MTIRSNLDAIDTLYPDGFERERLFRTQGDMLTPAERPSGGFWKRLRAGLADWRMKRAGRLALRELTDERLRDIGLTRAESRAEVAKSRFLD